MTQVSVTEVRNALRCPRLFVLGRSGASVRFPVGSSTMGALFHRLAERFVGGAAAPPDYFAGLSEQSAGERIADSLRRWLLGLLVAELEANATYVSMPTEVDELAEALRQLAGHLTARLVAFEGPPAARLTRLLQGAERSVEATIPGLDLVVSGRIDALYATPEGTTVVVEYKLTDERTLDLDRAQVALYQRLLRLDEGKLAHGAVLRFTPACSETKVSPDDAASIEQEVLLPLLRELPRWAHDPSTAPPTQRAELCCNCPVAARCAELYADNLPSRDLPPAGGLRPRPDAAGAMGLSAKSLPGEGVAADVEGQAEGEELGALVVKELRRLGLSAEIADRQVGARRVSLRLRVVRGSLKKLDAAADEVRMALGIPGVEYERLSFSRSFIVPRRSPKPVLLTTLLAAEQRWLAERPGRCVVGEQMNGLPLRVDLSDSATPHLLVGGQAGSGKSVLLQVITAGLVQFHGPDAVQLNVVDPKRVTFSPSFRTAIASHLDGPVLYDAEAALPLLEGLVEEMERRYALLEAAGVQDLQEYNEQASSADRLPRRVLLVDEFADLAAGDGAKAFFKHVDRLGAKARAAGIHLVLATQRPDRETVPPRLKANLGGKIALRVASAVNSRIILDQGGAQELLGQGDMLADLGRGVVRAQGAMLAPAARKGAG